MNLVLKYALLCTFLFLNACTEGIRSGDEIASYSEEEFAQGKKGVVVVFNPSFVGKHELDCSIEVTAKIVNVIDESKIYYAKINMTASKPAFFVGMLDSGIYYLDSILFKSNGKWSAQEASATFKFEVQRFLNFYKKLLEVSSNQEIFWESYCNLKYSHQNLPL